MLAISTSMPVIVVAIGISSGSNIWVTIRSGSCFSAVAVVVSVGSGLYRSSMASVVVENSSIKSKSGAFILYLLSLGYINFW